MSVIADVLAPYVESGDIPGLVALVAVADDVDVTVLGQQVVGGADMRADSLFRIASAGKPITAAAVLALIADGELAFDDPVADLLPELTAPSVLREPTAGLDDTLPAVRLITVAHLLRSTNGHGLPSELSAPIATRLLEHHQQGPPRPESFPPPDRWMERLGQVPMVHQPDEGFTYNTAYDILGVLVERACGRPFAEYVAERILRPVGMRDTGFNVPAGGLDRMTGLYRRGEGGHLELTDEPEGQWTTAPEFASGAGGWISTAADLLTFHRMLLSAGGDILPAGLVAAMTADQLTPTIRATNPTFLNGQSWGYGGGVDIAVHHPWNVPGRYGWVGGTGTSAYHVPVDGSVAILLTQIELQGPADAAVLETFWTAAAAHLAGRP